MNIFKNQLLV